MQDAKDESTKKEEWRAATADAAGKSATYGAAGAAIGSVVPVVGTVTGALLGVAVAGFVMFFSGPKRKK